MVPTHLLESTMNDDDIKLLCGWLGATEKQKGLARQFPTLAQAAPNLMGGPTPTEPILLYKAWKDVLGEYPKYVPQTIGDCVSHGWSHGNDLLQCVEIRLGEPAAYQETDTEVWYGMAREISGDLGRQDGSYGAAAAKAGMQWGMVSRAMMGKDGTYSGQRAKEYGLHGVGDAIKAMAKPFLLGNAAQTDTFDAVVAALAGGYPVPECSNFLPDGQRDKDGFVQPRGRGGHCQCIVGARFDRPGLCIVNSWGAEYFSGPCGLDCPPFGYWIDKDVFERWIAGSGDNFAISKSPAFVKRDLPPSWSYSDAA